MDTKIHYTIVGAFVIFLTSAFILGIIWLSSGFSFAQYNRYVIYMQESVAGLSIDSPVEYNGVNIGSVKNISLNRKDPHQVSVLINIKNEAPITYATVATLNTRGLTGLTYIALKDDGSDMRPLKKEKGQQYPVIQTAPSLFVRLDTALTQLTKNVKQVTESLQSALDPENLQMMKNILNNMNEVTGSLAQNSKKFDEIVNNTAEASRAFTPLLHRSLGAMKIFESQTMPQTYQLINNLNEMTRSLAETTAEVRQNPAILIRGINRSSEGK